LTFTLIDESLMLLVMLMLPWPAVSCQGVTKEDVEKAGASLQAASSGSSGSYDDTSVTSPVTTSTAVSTSDQLPVTRTASMPPSTVTSTSDALRSAKTGHRSSSLPDVDVSFYLQLVTLAFALFVGH